MQHQVKGKWNMHIVIQNNRLCSQGMLKMAFYFSIQINM